MQLFLARQLAGWFEMIDNGKRHQHGAAPRRHFVNVKWRPRWQQDHFHRYRRQIFPRELAQERQVKLAERVDAGDAAKAQNVGARFAHEWEIG
jgi:hypothetical protein